MTRWSSKRWSELKPAIIVVSQSTSKEKHTRHRFKLTFFVSQSPTIDYINFIVTNHNRCTTLVPTFFRPDAPYCVLNNQVYGVGTGDLVTVSCLVASRVTSGLRFHWRMNGSELPQSLQLPGQREMDMTSNQVDNSVVTPTQGIQL